MVLIQELFHAENMGHITKKYEGEPISNKKYMRKPLRSAILMC